MPRTALIPRGTPLTESMPFTGRDGGQWLAYIEGVAPEHPWGMWYRTMLPGRRLRFDSLAESRVADVVPSGAPFLAEPRLQLLLESAHPVPPTPPASRSHYKPWRRNPVVRWISRAADVGDAVKAESVHRWRLGAVRRASIAYRVWRVVSGTVESVVGAVGGSLSGRSRARP
ncbi:MAG TPA: hypothetical protein VMN37_09135 [Gemmatimonadales bacterium]|nr:hypothetical protein [Gemmatimonadales bacterium]